MRAAERLRHVFDHIVERPATTVDLRPLRALLPEVEEYSKRLAHLTDEELASAAAAIRAPGDAGTPGDPGTPVAGRRKPRSHAGGGTAVDRIAICALAREAAVRAIGERPYDVQLVGAMAMLAGHVVEMATGEGKTLTAAIAAFGYTLGGGPVHVLTVNDYLARRDAEWMGPVYERLGVSVGWVDESSTPAQRREAYARDVTYASVSEAGYDLLRDQLRTDPADAVQRGLGVVIVDEADSILIDEARVPLILAAARGDDPPSLRATTELVRDLVPDRHYAVAEDGRAVEITTDGITRIEAALGGIELYAADSLPWLTAVNLSLHAHALLRRDVEYIVRGGRVDLVDEYRGRVALRRRWPDGLQAAVEAKEGLDPTPATEVLGTITIQALIGLYRTACGMTATGARVGAQLREFYRLEVAVVPPNAPCVRLDEPDRIYASREAKETALVDEIVTAHGQGRPVLIGTLDVAESERLADRLREAGVPCTVLNANNDAEEAAIIADAGAPGAVTVSTQMAGRGIDIRLGGHDQADREAVVALDGLYVIGTGRHDSRRVDDQLRGRAGRQADPGGSVFFVSLEDELVTRYGRDALPRTALVEADGCVYDRAAGRAVERGQRVAESTTFEIHRNTWRYNVVIEQQRQILAERRHRLLTTDAAAELLARRSPSRYDRVRHRIGADALAGAARSIALYHLDRRWADHLAYLAEIREGVYLRAIANLDPLDEFHRAAVPPFTRLLSDVDNDTVGTFDEVDITGPEWTIADAGLSRPTATWTYMVHDNPFGSHSELFAALLRWAIRS